MSGDRKDAPGLMVKATVLLANTPMAIAFGSISPVIAKIDADLSHGPTDTYMVRMLVGVLGIAMVLGAPLAGLLTDRIGRRRLLFGAGLLYAVAGCAPLFLDDLPLLLASRFFVGLAGIAFAVAGTALIGDSFDAKDQPRWMGIYVAAAMGATLIVVPIAGYIGDFGWRWPFALHGFGLVLALFALGTGKAARRRAEPVAATGGKAPFPFGLILLALLTGTMVYVPSVYVPFLLRDHGVLAPSMIAILFTFRGGINVVCALLFGKIRQFVSAQHMFAIGFGMVAAGATIVGLAPDYIWVTVGLSIAAIGTAWLPPNLLATGVGRSTEANRGKVMGMVTGANSMAAAVGITALEPLVRVVGITGIFLLMAGVAAALALGFAVKRPAEGER